jgi:3-methyladenine DNA glycosylase/8-oxoguanine DNA glycosylase
VTLRFRGRLRPVEHEREERTIPWTAPLDLGRTFAPLVRGQGDRTIRVSSTRVWWTTRTADGPATIRLERADDGLHVTGWGPGATSVVARADRLAGLDDTRRSVGALHDVEDPRVVRLARRFGAVRLTRTEAVLHALVPAILEQKVTGTEAHRAWNGLVRRYGEDAPGPSAIALGLRLPPRPAVLARLPDHEFHRLGVEGRRAALIRAVARQAPRWEGMSAVPPAEAAVRLQAIPGIGPWTAAEVAVRAWGDPDAVSVGDFHLKHLVAFALAGEPRADDARMLELLAPFAGRRALVVRALELGGPRPPRYGPRLAPRDIRDL